MRMILDMLLDGITPITSLIGFWRKLSRLTALEKACVTSTELISTTKPTKRKALISNNKLKEDFNEENQDFNYADEPSSALDVTSQKMVIKMMRDLMEKGLIKSMIFITHELPLLYNVTDDIMVMYLGQCVEKASSDELFANPCHPYTKALLSAIPVPNLSMRNKKAHVIRGEVVSPINPKPGCRFAVRCDHCSEICTKQDLPLNEIAPNHFIACPYAEEAFKKA